MSDLEIKTARVVTRTVRIELSVEQVEAIVAEHVMRENRSKLRDFGLRATISHDESGFLCIVDGSATKET